MLTEILTAATELTMKIQIDLHPHKVLPLEPGFMDIPLRVVKRAVARFNMTVTKNNVGEYRLNVKGWGEDTAYYTESVYDVLWTALQWHRYIEKQVQA